MGGGETAGIWKSVLVIGLLCFTVYKDHTHLMAGIDTLLNVHRML